MSSKAIASFIVGALFVSGGLAAFSPVSAIQAEQAGAAAVGPAFPVAERITCTTTAQDIKPSGSHSLVSYQCTAKGNVVVGGPTGVGSTLTASTGTEYADAALFGANVKSPEQCITASSTTVIQCRFLVTAAP